MQPGDLEPYSTKELIEELMRRRTFLGVVIHSAAEHKQADWNGERMFSVHYNSNLESAEVALLLNAVTSYMDRSHW